MISIDRISRNMCGFGIVELTIQAHERDLFNLDGFGEVTANEIVNLALNGYKPKAPKVERVIQNGPATIVFWDDGEKTVVKCRECADGKCIHDKDRVDYLDYVTRCVTCGFASDPEKAIMAAMLKRLYKNYQDVLREALEVEDG